jgi:hypothetical protein
MGAIRLLGSPRARSILNKMGFGIKEMCGCATVATLN